MATDKEGRDFCVVVIKGTFLIGPDGLPRLAEEQEPMVYADVHYGDPGTTSIKYESDFAQFKPGMDVLVNGNAYSPTGKPVEDLYASLEANSIRKQVRVVGDRMWEGTAVHMHPSRPTPFVQMPLVFERAFGGSDNSHADPKRQGTELRNPVGVGFHRNDEDWTIQGTALPNLEDPLSPIGSWSDTPPPASFGFVGRGWHPRIRHAGTYDEKWKETQFPFLPADFDERYFLAAPPDQQIPQLQGGEPVRCTNMSPTHVFSFTVPKINIPLVFRFRDRDVTAVPKLDTLIIEPEAKRVLVVLRARAALGRKLRALREVVVGTPPRPPRKRMTNKPYFSSLAELIEWKRRRLPS